MRIDPVTWAREARFVPNIGQSLAILVATGLVAGFQVLVHRDGHPVHVGAECSMRDEPDAGERITVFVRCTSGDHAVEASSRDGRTVLAFLRDRPTTLRCDVMASGILANCR